MKKYILITFLVYSSVFSYSQIDTIKNQRIFSIGINAGMTTGTGLSFRYMPNKFGVQFSAIPIISIPINSPQSKVQKSGTLSFTVLRQLKSAKKIDFNFYEAQTLLFDDDITVSVGAGSLADIKLGYDMSLSINIGLAFITGDFLDDNWLLLPDFGFGFYYKF